MYIYVPSITIITDFLSLYILSIISNLYSIPFFMLFILFSCNLKIAVVKTIIINVIYL